MEAIAKIRAYEKGKLENLIILLFYFNLMPFSGEYGLEEATTDLTNCRRQLKVKTYMKKNFTSDRLKNLFRRSAMPTSTS